jgi:acyl-CoA dehydrogenase
MFEQSESAKHLYGQVSEFMDAYVYPAEAVFEEQMAAATDRYKYPPILVELRARAKAAGLWNFAIPERLSGMGLGLTQFAPISELIQRSELGAETFNSYPGTVGNIMLLDGFATEAVKQQFMWPMIEGKIRSCISITERDVPSSDPTNLKFPIRTDGDSYVLNGKKAWATASMQQECELLLMFGVTAPDAERHARHSLVAVPRSAPGVSFGRIETVFGYDHAPYVHNDLILENVRVPRENLIGKEGDGFAMMQHGLGFSRIQLGMHSIGSAERAVSLMCQWVDERIIGGKPLSDRGVVLDAIARSRIEIEQARQMVLKTAYIVETAGTRAARSEIAQCKVLAPEMALKVLDRAIQFHGGMGVSQHTPLASMWAYQRVTRIGEGADEVHRETIAKIELKQQRDARAKAKAPLASVA